ncbi:MFS transporter [Phenylobacterium sp. J367]|uniref:MFS transporter n=1 Tax=Phenylobacterium sp. J367 TaxID=2898435 RepID=UPI002151463B|nr:MFS transporter [Phenylobacterium sp. J367]
MPQIVTSKPTFWYVLLATILFNLATSVQQLNVISWGGELSTRYAERTRIMGWRAGFAALAKLMAFGIPAAMEWLIPHASIGDKLQALMWTVIVLLPFTTVVAVMAVPEKPADANPAAAAPKFTLGDLWLTLGRMVSNKYLGRILLVELLQAGPTAVKGALFVFYVSYIMKAPGFTATLLLFVYGATLLSTPIWMRLAKGREKHRLLAISVLLYGCSQASMMFWGPDQLVFFIIAIAMNGVMNAGPNFLMHSIMVDVVDSDTVLTGKQQTGAFFAVLETTTKAAPGPGGHGDFPCPAGGRL